MSLEPVFYNYNFHATFDNNDFLSIFDNVFLSQNIHCLSNFCWYSTIMIFFVKILTFVSHLCCQKITIFYWNINSFLKILTTSRNIRFSIKIIEIFVTVLSFWIIVLYRNMNFLLILSLFLWINLCALFFVFYYFMFKYHFRSKFLSNYNFYAILWLMMTLIFGSFYVEILLCSQNTVSFSVDSQYFMPFFGNIFQFFIKTLNFLSK